MGDPVAGTVSSAEALYRLATKGERQKDHLAPLAGPFAFIVFAWA